MPPRRKTYRKRRPFRRAAPKKDFWSHVRQVAKGAVNAAKEIKRWLISTNTLTIAPNLITDWVGPTYVDQNSWTVRPLQEGLAQGPDQNERDGNKVQIKGVKIKAQFTNTAPGSQTIRAIVFRMQHNYLLDAGNTPAPTPSDFLSYPRYRDVQILMDKSFSLSGTGLDGDQRTMNFYREVRQPTFFLDNTANKPDKGTIFFATTTSSASATMKWSSEVTFHDMS